MTAAYKHPHNPRSCELPSLNFDHSDLNFDKIMNYFDCLDYDLFFFLVSTA